MPANFAVVRDVLHRLAEAAGFDDDIALNALVENLLQVNVTAKTADTTSSGSATDLTALTTRVTAVETSEAATADEAALALALSTSQTPFALSPHVFAWTGDAAGSLTYDGSQDVSAAVVVTKTGGVAFGYFATGTDAANLTGTVSVNRFNSGTGASSTTFLRGDGTWAAPAGTTYTADEATLHLTGTVFSIKALGVGTAQIAANAVTLAKLATQADQTILANNSGGVAVPSALTAAQVRTLLSLVIGTNVQAWDADLDAIAALSGSDLIPYRSAPNTWGSVSVGSGLSFVGGALVATGGGSGGGTGVDLFNHSFLGGI